jgi:flavorubredoxin
LRTTRRHPCSPRAILSTAHRAGQQIPHIREIDFISIPSQNSDMETRIDPVDQDVYRIATWEPAYGITFNQFLIADEKPTIVHTGTYQVYEAVRKAIAQVLDPATLAYIVIPHFESDECGGMSRFVADAPGCRLVASELGAALNLAGWQFCGPFKGMRDGDRLELGKHRLRFIETPHVHHWDSMMVVDETTQSLFPADLFLQPGEQPPIVQENLGREMCELYRAAGIFGSRDPVLQTVDRLEKMSLRRIHPMHGGSLIPDISAKYIDALRTQRFWYDGRLFGRALPT